MRAASFGILPAFFGNEALWGAIRGGKPVEIVWISGRCRQRAEVATVADGAGDRDRSGTDRQPSRADGRQALGDVVSLSRIRPMLVDRSALSGIASRYPVILFAPVSSSRTASALFARLPCRGRRCQWQAKTAHYWQLKIAHFGGVRRWGTEAGRANRHGVRALCGVSIAVRNCAHSSRIARCRGGRAAPEPRSPVDVPSALRAGRRERSDRRPARSAEGGGPGHGAPPSSSGRACSRS